MKKPIAILISLLLVFYALFAGCNTITPIGAGSANKGDEPQAPSLSPPAQATEPAAASLPFDEGVEEGDDKNSITGKWNDANEKDLVPLDNMKGRLAPGMPEWAFGLSGRLEDGQSWFESVVLTTRDESGRIVDSSEAMSTNGSVNDPHILLVDANFDGYLDVLYTEGGVGAHENYWYILRLWGAQSNTFRPGEGFEEICNPVIDEKDKLIRSCGAGSAFEDIYSIYEYEGDVYRLVMELVLTYDEINGVEHRAYEVYSYSTGEAKLLKKSKGSGMPDPNKPGEADFWGPNSIWKLDDPIWYKSRHFQGSGE